MATADWLDEDLWEVVNDDGFVYKRKKRRLDPTVSTSAPPPPDPAAEEKNRRVWKKRALVKLKEKYQKEIDHWEHLSNTLKAMQEKAQNHQQRRGQAMASSSLAVDLVPPPAPAPAPAQAQSQSQSSETTCRRLVDDLLLKVEAEEAIIQDVSNLCNMAEAICNKQEEHMNQAFFNLPIWASPRELMTSLCDEKRKPTFE